MKGVKRTKGGGPKCGVKEMVGGTKSNGWEERAYADAEMSGSVSIWNSKK